MEKIKRRSDWFWGITGLVYLILFTVEYALSSKEILNTGINLGRAMFLLHVLYTVGSFRIIGPTEQGVRLLFGKPINSIPSGIKFIPFGICELVKLPCLLIKNEFPGNPEEIYRGDGEMPKGKFPPIRIPFGHPTHDTELLVLDRDPLNQRLIEEVVPLVWWQIKDAVTFLVTIGSVEEAERQLEDLSVATLSREFGKVTPAKVIEDYKFYNEILGNDLVEATQAWGVVIRDAKAKVINFSHDLNGAIQEIAEETAKGKALTIKAEGLKRQKILLGEGEGTAEKAVLKGRTQGIKNMTNSLKIPAEMVIGAETARAITNNPGQKTIITGLSGFREIMAIIEASRGNSAITEPPKKIQEGVNNEKP